MLPPPTNPTRLSWTDTVSPLDGARRRAPGVHGSASPGPEDRSPDPHDRRALLDADFEVAAHPHRQLGELGDRAPCPGRCRAASASPGSAAGSPQGPGAAAGSSSDPRSRSPGAPPSPPARARGPGRTPPFCGSSPTLTWTSTSTGAPPSAARRDSVSARASRSTDWIEVEAVARRPGPCSSGGGRSGATGTAGRARRSSPAPPARGSRRARGLPPRSRPAPLDVDGLGHGDEENGVRAAPGAAGRLGHPLPHGVEIRTNARIDHGRRYCSGFACPAPRCRAPAGPVTQDRRASRGCPPGPPSGTRRRGRSRQPVQRRGLEIAPGGTPTAASCSALAVHRSSHQCLADPGAPIAATPRGTPRARGPPRARRPRSSTGRWTARSRPGAGGLAPRPPRPAPRRAGRRSPRSAAPSRVGHAERRPLRIDDDQRHAVGGEDRQRPRSPAGEQGVPRADQPRASAASASRQTSPCT